MVNSSDQAVDQQGAIDDVLADYLQRVDEGEAIDRTEFIAANPDVADALKSYFAGADEVDRVAGPTVAETMGAAARENDTAVASESQPAATGTDGAIPREFGRYRVVRTLGTGAMGAVYLADDTQLDRQVALKVPKFAKKERSELLLRFNREAKAAATLSHPNVCPVFDVGEIDGTHFISMGYVEGRPLNELIDPERPLSEVQVASVIRKLALALAEAHQKGVVHRDIKPANIMIDKRREPIIMDFGLARSLAVTDEARVTHDGAIVGTPAYMPPEQIKGDIAKVGPAADIYSLGVVMYEMLTGRLPFTGSVTEVIARVLHDPPPNAAALRPNIDSRLDTICQKAMSKALADRYASMNDFAADLTAYIQQRNDQPAKNAIPPQQTGKTSMASTSSQAADNNTADNAADNDNTVQKPSAGEFDPYHKWLGIPPREQPPNHYRLLAIELFEADADAIQSAAIARSTYVRQCASGPHAAVSQEVLNQLSEAEICLLNSEKKAAYDAQLKAELKAKEAAKPPAAGAATETVSMGEKAKPAPGSKLAQQIQKLDKQKKQIEALLEKCEFATAISALEKMAAVKSPKLAKYAKWAQQQIPKAKGGTKEMRESSAAVYRTAAGLFDRNDYEEAAEMLQQIPKKYRDAEFSELLQECLDLQEEIVVLQEDIDHAESLNKYEDLQPTVERLLELKPADRRARRLLKELKTYGKGGGMRLGGRGDKRFDAAGNTSNPLKVALGILIPVVLFGAVGYATVVYVRSNNKTIKIEIDDPSAKVVIDGETVKITGVGDEITLKVGMHDLVVERDGLVVRTNQFEVVKGKNPVLRISLEDAAVNSPTPTVVGSGNDADSLTDALPITIAAKDDRGFEVGPVKAGTELQFQYVSGKWKGWGSRADISPDNTTGRGGDSCFLTIVDYPKGDTTTGKILTFVAEGTAQKPFKYVLPQDAKNLVLRINDRGDGWAGNPGSVQYKVLVGGKSLGGVPPGNSGSPAGTPGLVAYYPLDEKSGTTFKDASGNGHDGTIKGQLRRIQGKHGNAIETINKSYVDLGKTADFEWSDAFSIGAWVQKPKNGHMAMVIRSTGQPDYRGFDLMLNEGYPLVHLIGKHPNNVIRVVGTKPIASTGWQHVMMTYDGSGWAGGVKLYVNGTLEKGRVSDNSLKKSTIKSDKSLSIGYLDPGGLIRDGAIDDVQIYNRVLTAAEVQKAMSPPGGGSAAPAGPPTGIANVEITPAVKFNKLEVGAKISLGKSKFTWTEIPNELQGRSFSAQAPYSGITRFKVTKDGPVLVAFTKGWGGGGRGGPWQKEVVSRQQLEQQGWKEVAQLMLDSKEVWLVFSRDCKAGEEFAMRNNKYSAPFLISPPTGPGSQAGAAVDVSKQPVICQLLQSKRAPQGLNPQAVKFAAPDGDGRRGANGFLLDAPAGWDTKGTVWSCDFARDGASRGVVFIHPYKDGHVMVVASAGGLHVGSPGEWPNDRNASLYGPRYKGFPLQASPDFKQVFQLGDKSHQLVSKLAADGSYEFLLDGKVVATTQVDSVLPLKFTDAITVAKPPAKGTGGAIVGPTDQGSARASKMRFGTIGGSAEGGTATTAPQDNSSLAVAPFDAVAAKKHQEDAAKRLGTTVETLNSVGMKFRLIPPGTFTMGSPQSEIDTLVAITSNQAMQTRYQSEGPQHQVTLTKPLYLGAHEVTAAQYEQVMGSNPAYFSSGGEGKDLVAGLDTKSLPVEQVSWFDAIDFCNKLSQQEGLSPCYSRAGDTVTIVNGNGYRLPTEAEWEYAARAGAQTRWSFGDDEQELSKHGWIGSNSKSRTHAVGKRSPNAFGLFDMHGNLWEWCYDWYGEQFYALASGGADPIGPSQGTMRTLRGGSYHNDKIENVRQAYRGFDKPDSRDRRFGFRIAKVVAGQGTN